MDLAFQIAMPYCSLQHQVSLPTPVSSTVLGLKLFSPVGGNNLADIKRNTERPLKQSSFIFSFLLKTLSKEESHS